MSNNPKEIKFVYLDPFNHLNYKKELGKEGEVTSSVVEYLFIKLSKKFSGKKVFFRVLTSEYYKWQMHAPFDDIIIAYSFKKDFTFKEAGCIFNRKNGFES